jgi:hypothetical protein
MYESQIVELQQRLAELSARVVELEAKVGFLLMHEPTPYVPVTAEELDANEAAVAEALKKGNMKEALQIYRQKHQVDFAEAKKGLEEMRLRLGL